MTIGSLLSVGGLYTLTEALDNKIVAFAIPAVLQLVWAVLVFFMITEPDVRNDKEQKRNDRKSFCGKLFSMLKQAYKAC